MQIPQTQNKMYGFYGTCDDAGLNPDEFWNAAVEQIHQITNECPQDIAIFLDSRSGRHFANDVISQFYRHKNQQVAIDLATKSWQCYPSGKLRWLD